MSSTIKLPKFCNHCGITYIAQKTTTKYCSHRCNNAALKKVKREEKVNDAFLTQQSRIGLHKTKEVIPQQIPHAVNHLTLSSKEFLSILEVATLLGASRWTIQRLIKSKRLPFAKLGSRTIIRRASLDNLFN